MTQETNWIESIMKQLNVPDIPTQKPRDEIFYGYVKFSIISGLLVRKQMRHFLQEIKWLVDDVHIEWEELKSWLDSTFLITIKGEKEAVLRTYNNIILSMEEFNKEESK